MLTPCFPRNLPLGECCKRHLSERGWCLRQSSGGRPALPVSQGSTPREGTAAGIFPPAAGRRDPRGDATDLGTVVLNFKLSF